MREPAGQPAGQPAAFGAVREALLVVDSSDQGRRFGLRGTGTAERRLLFRAPGAHVELRIVPTRPGARLSWLQGMVVEPGVEPAAGARVRVRWSAPGHEPSEVEARETGEFTLPCATTGAFLLELFRPGRPPVAVRVDA